MNSAVKQLPRSLSRLVGRWASLFSWLLLVLPSFGQGFSVTQPQTIIINDATLDLANPGQSIPSQASVYPSSIVISNQFTGNIQKAAVTLQGLTHGYAADVDVLLVGPAGEKIILLSDVGLNFPFSGGDITIDDEAGSALPSASAITPGTFRSSNYLPDETFPLVSAPYPDALGIFTNTSPVGEWKLYVIDDKFEAAGSISGWRLTLWTDPSFKSVSTNKVVTREDEPATITVELQDTDTPANSLILTATSGDTAVISHTNITASTSGSVRTVTITPNKDRSGTNTLTLTVDDGRKKVNRIIDFEVQAVNDAPTLALSTNVVSTVATVPITSVTATVADIDSELANISIFATSSNTNLIPAENVVDATGTGGTRSLVIAPKGGATGTATLQIFAKDNGTTNTTSIASNIVVTVNPVPQAVFANTAPIALTDNSVASPYPSSVTVSNVAGQIGKVVVSLANLKHPRPEDLDFLLVAPGGAVSLMGQAGGTSAANGVWLAFDDGAVSAIPDSEALTTGTFKPADYTAGALPSPAPGLPYGTTLGVLQGTEPNGVWSLYAVDRVDGSSGVLSGGFSVRIFPAPLVSGLVNKVTDEDNPTSLSVIVSDYDGTVTNLVAIPDDPALTSASASFSGGTGRVDLSPKLNQFGSTIVRLIVTDNDGFKYTNSFTLTVNAVNDAPTVDPIAKQVTYAGLPLGPISFAVSDVETPAGDLVVTARSSNTKLLPDSNIVIGGSGATRTFTLFPVGIQEGTAEIQIVARDNGGPSPVKEGSATFTLTVLPPASPLYANATPIVIADSGTAGVGTNASPYPSTIVVSNLVGAVQSVRVTLLGLQHPFASDVDVMLVGPDNNKVVLMTGAGGSASINNVQLVFQDGATVLPASGGIPSGIYRPSNLDGKSEAAFPGVPSGGTLSTSLSIFNSLGSPNGTWSLWVRDDNGNEKGATIAGGWMINFQTGPKLTDIPDQTTPEDTEKRVSVTIGDEQPGVPVTITASSSNTGLVQNSKLVFEGAGATRTLKITPESNQFGETTITVSVTIGGATASDTFKLTVTAVDDAPAITAIENQTSPAGLIKGPITFSVSDPETSDPSTIAISIESSNQSLLPNGNVVVETAGGTRRLYILPNGVDTGTSTITVTAKDNTNQKSSRSFEFAYLRNLSRANAEPIDIRDNSTALKYPSVINLSGISGLVSKVKVTVRGLAHTFPDDVSILLVSPDNSKKVVLMANAGGGFPTNSLTGIIFGFDDSAASALPDESRIIDRVYRPASYGSPAFPSPAPGGPYGSTLADFNGISPNGDWKLYVIDDTFSDSGSISLGWILVVETAPEIAPIANQEMAEDGTLNVPILVADSDTDAQNLRTAAISSDETLVNNTNLVITPTNTLDRVLTLRPQPNASGTNLITVSVTDGTVTTTRSFGLKVNAVDDAPTIGTATNLVVINEDTGTNIVFNIQDVDSELSVTNATILSSVVTVVSNVTSSLSLAGPTNVPVNVSTSIVVSVVPNLNATGDTVLTFGIKDKTTTSTRDVTLRVLPINDAPTISTITNRSLIAGGTLDNISFSVGDVETPAKNLSVTASSSNPALVVPTVVGGPTGGSGAERLLSLAAIGVGTGSATITVTVKDENNAETSTTFVVTVTPAPGTVFANTTPITINASGKASVYPSVITVAGLAGAVHQVQVTLDGFTHTAPDDVDIVLVSPAGRKVLLASDAGGRIAVSDARLEFIDGFAAIPDDGPLTSGRFSPSNYDGALDVFPDGPVAPFATALSDFVGTNPNGNWSLYIVDDTAADSGSLSRGWSLKVITAPTIAISTSSPLVFNEDEPSAVSRTVNFSVSDTDSSSAADQLEITFASTHPTLIPPDQITTTQTGGGPTGGGPYAFAAVLKPGENLSGTNNLTITITRKSDRARVSASIAVTVVLLNDSPVISRLVERTTEQDRPITISFLVSDVDTAPKDIGIEVTSSNETLISNANLLLYGQTNRLAALPSNEVLLTLQPNANQIGTGTITVTVTDKSTNSPTPIVVASSFTFRVTDFNDMPTISAIADKAISAGQSTTNIAFVVDDKDLGSNLKVTGASSDETLIKNASIVITPAEGLSGTSATNRTVRVTSEVGVQGRATITLFVTDGSKTNSTSFNVNVVPSRERRFANTRAFNIRDNAAAADYPSVINVTGLVGDVDKVRVRLLGFAHGFPDDVDVLLVSPGGKKVAIMSDAGGGTSVTNVNLTIDDEAGADLPDSGALTSGTYRPKNYDTANDPYPSPAPAAPFDTTLSAFKGTPAAGEWRLYVVDDTPSDSGFLNGGWELLVTTQPRIEGLANVSVVEDAEFRVPFTIVEEETAPLDFTFGTASSNVTVVATSGLSFKGSGTSWTLIGQPVLNASGVSEITVFATNAFAQVVSSKFKVTVTAVDDFPTITDVPDQVIFSGTTAGPIAFDYGDAETAKKDIRLRIESSNPALVPTNNVFIVGNTLTIAPVGAEAGTAELTLTATDSANQSSSTAFFVRVAKALNPQFANSGSITLRDNNSADPYPSSIEVSGVSGTIARVTVTVAQLTHPYPADLDFLLVGPGGSNKVTMMSDAAGSFALSNARFTFDSRSTNEIPFNPSSTVTNGTYKPTNHQGADVFPAPAPAGPYSASLDVFVGTNPNGTWSLYALDDASPDSGVLSGGWILNIITTDPTISPIADQNTDENVPITVAFRVDDADTPATNLVVGASSNNEALLGLELSGTGNDRTIKITPAAFASGSGLVTIAVTDGSAVASTSFNVTVNPVNQAPEIAGLANQRTPANRDLLVPFTVTDRETPSSNLVVAASLSKASIGTVEIRGSDANRTLVFDPSGEQGQTFVNVTASDGELTTTNIISIDVGAPYILVVSPIADQTMDGNTTRTVNFTVSGSETGNITATAAAAGTSLVDRITVAKVGGSVSNFAATIILKRDQAGTDTVTVIARDEFGEGSTSFGLTVVAPPAPPTIGAIADQKTGQNVPKIVALNITDADTPINQLVLTWATSSSAIVRNVSFGLVDGTNVVATVFPVRDALGQATVTIFVSDGRTQAGQAFLFTVANEPPVFAPIADQTTTANTPVVIPLTVTDPDTPLANLVYSSTTSNPGLVSGVVVDSSSGSPIATVNLVADKTGIGTVTISVNDGRNTVSQTFALSVGPATPPTLALPAINVVDGVVTITVTWSGGGELEYASSPLGPWVGTGNTSGSFSEPATDGSKYYRVRR